MVKKKILIVGSFKETTKDGHVGGQRFACRTLINSEISNRVDWLLVDSTSPTIAKRPFYKRSTMAVIRFIRFSYLLVFRGPKDVLIFTVDGFGFIEKGCMALFAKTLGKRVILAPRSGLIPRDLEHSKILSRFIPYVFERCDFIICQSEKWRILFEKYINESSNVKLIVIENWIDTNKEYSPLPRGQELIIVFLGWIEETKGVFDLYKGFKEALKETQNIRLQFAGKGSSLDKLIKRVNEDGLSDKVDFLGWITKSEKRDVLNCAQVFVLPSFFEGFPNSLLEAMLYGKACIATKVGSIDDIIVENQNGFLIEIGEVDKIANTIVRLESDDALLKRIGSEAREKILRDNSIGSAITKFDEIIDLK